MVDQIIRPSALPRRASPVASEITPVDDGVTVAGSTLREISEAGRPSATQAEAVAGTESHKAMTPLTTKQAIDAQVPSKINSAIDALNLGTASQSNASDFATAAQGSAADTALQSVQPSTTVLVNNTDPKNPILSSIIPDDTITTPKLAFPLIRRIGPWTLSSFNQGAGFGNESSDTAAMNAAVASGERHILVDEVQFVISAGTYNIPANTKWSARGRGATLHCPDPSLNVGFLRFGSNCEFDGLTLRGPQDTVSTYVAGQSALVTGNTGSDIENVRFSNLEVYGFAQYGVHAHRMKNMRSTNNRFHDLGRAGFLMVGGEDCVHVADVVKNIGPGSGGNGVWINRYGFAYSNDGADEGFPRPKNISFFSCGVEEIPTWTGFDSHGADGFNVVNCWTRRVANPIYFGPSSGTNESPCNNFSLIGGVFDAGGMTLTRAGVIASWKSGSLGGQGGRIIAPTFIGHGLNQAAYNTGNYTLEGCIHVLYQDDIVIKDPILINTNQAAIMFRREVENVSISGHIIDGVNETNSVSTGIYVEQAQNCRPAIGKGSIKNANTAITILGSTPSAAYGPKVDKQDISLVTNELSTGSWGRMNERSQYQLTGSVTTNLAEIPAGSGLNVAISVPEAAIGDRVSSVAASAATPDDLLLIGPYVRTAGSVRFKAQNFGSIPADPASMTYSVSVSKPLA